MNLKIDVFVSDDPRAHEISLTNETGGIVFESADVKLSFGVRPLVAAVLSIASEGKDPIASWARRCRASMPGCG